MKVERWQICYAIIVSVGLVVGYLTHPLIGVGVILGGMLIVELFL
jgi:hypothetical protein